MKKIILSSGLFLVLLTLSACPAPNAADGSSNGSTDGSTSGNVNVGVDGNLQATSLTKAQYIQILTCAKGKNPAAAVAFDAQINAINSIPESSWAVIASQAQFQASLNQAVAAACGV